ncbi:MAG: HEPN domain-containing protein [Blastocatellia bacterium]
MKQSTMEWIEKAEGDWDVAQRVYRARKKTNYDAACFHVQQCVEKYLKARLNEVGIVFDKTHNLSDLLDILLPIEPTWTPLRPVVHPFTKYAILYSYPGYNATRIEAKTVLADCCEARRVIRATFGLPV